ARAKWVGVPKWAAYSESVMRALITWAALLLGVSCLALAWWQYPRNPPSAAITIERPEQHDLRLPAGTHTVSFILRNPGRVPVRVVGASDVCEDCNLN